MKKYENIKILSVICTIIVILIIFFLIFKIQNQNINYNEEKVKNEIENKLENRIENKSYVNESMENSNNIPTNKLTSYIPKQDPNKDYTIPKTEEYTIVRDREKVKLEIIEESVTTTGCYLKVVDKNECQYGWDERYRLEVKNGEEWEVVKYITNQYSFLDVLMGMENGETVQIINWKSLYGSLDSGTYRIVKVVYDNESKGNIDFYSNEFEIN